MSMTIGNGVQNTGYTNTNNTTKRAETTRATETKNATATSASTTAATATNANVVQTNSTGDTLEVSQRAQAATTNTENTAPAKTEKKQVDEKELAKLLAESKQETQQFMNFMKKVLNNQAKNDSVAKLTGNDASEKTNPMDDLASILDSDTSMDDLVSTVSDLKKGLEDGTLKVSQEDIDKAKELTSEDGYYGVKKTSARIVDFAKAVSGGDTSKAEMLREAAIKGFESAAELWGGMENAPQITKDTYAAVMKGFDEWVGGSSAPKQA